MKDPTEFKQRFAAWKAGNKVYDAGKPIEDDYLPVVKYYTEKDLDKLFGTYNTPFVKDNNIVPFDQNGWNSNKNDPEVRKDLTEWINELMTDNKVSVDGGELGNVVVTPTKQDKKILRLFKKAIPNKQIRNTIYEDLDVEDEFLPLTNKTLSQNEKVRNIVSIWQMSGNPSTYNGILDFFARYPGTSDRRPNYNMWNNSIGNIGFNYDLGALDDYLAELSHAYLFSKYAPKKIRENLLTRFLSLPGDIKINGKDGYSRPGNLEYNAHSIIEPAIRDYIQYEKYPSVLSLNDRIDLVNLAEEQLRNAVETGTKSAFFKSIKPLPKYDDGTDEEDPPSVKLSREIMSILRGGDFEPDRIESGEPSESDAQATYLLSRKQLRELFLKHGYIESPKDYGLVKKAVGKRDLPVYQRSKDQIDRLSVIPIGNVDTLWGGDSDDMLVHAGNYPTTVYLDPKTLDLYQKAWDLNDYGPSSGGAAKHYGFPKQIAANLLDLIGSPVVVTTGIRKIKYPKQDEFLNLKDNYMKSKGYHIIEDYEDVPLYDMSGKNVIGKFSEKTKRYTLPEVEVVAPKKYNNGKSIKSLAKYDDGTGDKTYLPEYEYEATVTPQGTSLEKHKRITNEEDWLKYWGNVGAGYVNNALEKAFGVLSGEPYMRKVGNRPINDAWLRLWDKWNTYDKGKSIHINPANKGKFNATKKRTGKTTEQLAHSKNPLTRKRAIFALNSRKFKH